MVLAENSSVVLVTGRPFTPINQVIFRNIQAGSYHALLAYSYQTSDRLLTEKAEKTFGQRQSESKSKSNLDETQGEFLHLVGLKYLRHVDDVARKIGELDGGSGQSGHHLGLTTSRMKVEYVLDQPFAITREGFVIDVPGGVSRNVDLSSGQVVLKSFKLLGYAASLLESYIWQENGRLDAVSSVRGIQFAKEPATNIPVLTIPTSNQLSELCTASTPCGQQSLYHSAQTAATLQTLINEGFTVTVPRSQIEYDNWEGLVYIAEKFNGTPSTHCLSGYCASFAIGGDYAGGWSTIRLDSIFKEPLGSGWVYSIPDNVGTTVDATIGSNVGLGYVPQYSTTAGDPVNMVNGNMYHVERDITIKGRGGLPFVFERSYSSRDKKNGPLGFGWTHSFHHYLIFNDDNADGIANSEDSNKQTSSVSWFDGTGSEKYITVNGDKSGVPNGSTFSSPKGFFFVTTRNGTYSITEKNGLTYTFENVAGDIGQKAKLTSIKDRNGNTLTLAYTNGLLSTVTDGLARSLTFFYDGSSRITEVRDWTGRKHQYGYDILAVRGESRCWLLQPVTDI